MDQENPSRFVQYTILTGGALCLVLVGYLTYQVVALKTELMTVTVDRDTLIVENASSTEALGVAQSTIEALASKLSLTADELANLEDDYRAEKKKNDNFEDQIQEISGTLGDLDKLSKTDKELLQKYSKVYFLNEHYIPEKIVKIDKEYLYNEDVAKQIHSKVEPFLNDMLDDALDDGVKIWVISAYRSFSEQTNLKGSYTTTYGSGANTFSADQGYSEHQLGTTLDFTTEGLSGGLTGFQNTEAYQWLQKHARKYGFTLSYPEDNAYYVFEPWHWRFVGEDLAKDLNRVDAHFYDWDQRKIDTYLIKIFD